VNQANRTDKSNLNNISSNTLRMIIELVLVQKLRDSQKRMEQGRLIKKEEKKEKKTKKIAVRTILIS